MADPTTLALFSLFCCALYFALQRYQLRHLQSANPRKLPYPPGPKPELIIGNTRHIPPHSSWLQYTKWKKDFGDIIHLEALGKHIVVLNSYDISHELLDVRPTYSDRPNAPMLCDLMGWKGIVPNLPYDDKWRRCRKLMHSILHKDAIKDYSPALERYTRVFLSQLMDSPESFSEHLRLLTGKSIVMFTYGIEVKSGEDELIVVPEDTIATATKVAFPGAVLVDTFPLLMYVPSWFPGAAFKRNAKAWKKIVLKMVSDPYLRVKADVDAGVAAPSFTSACLEDGTHDERDIMWSAASMYTAGADTTHASLVTFFLAMATHPDVQAKAQAEIDQVIKANNKLPSFEDRDSLPYVNCLLKEVQRWIPATPLVPIIKALPHRAMENDYYEGYYISGGSIVLGNVWSITQDEAVYQNPKQFWPERFENLETAELDPYKYAFGFGRRSCAGVNFADALLYIAVVSILATFNIRKPRGENGEEVEPKVTLTGGIICRPENLKCTIQPRSDAAIALLRSIADE